MLKCSLSVLRSQWPHIRGKSEYEKEYKAGIRNAQEYYGGRLISQIEDHIRLLHWKEAAAKTMSLLKWYRKGFVRSFLPALYFNGARITHNVWNSDIMVSLRRILNDADGNRSGLTREGCHDGADCSMIAGWGRDTSQPDVPIKVDIYVDRCLLATVTAGEFREDLAAAGKGRGNHAFRYPLPRWLRDGKPHSVKVKFHGSGIDLDLTPREICCESERGESLATDLLRCAFKAAKGYVRSPQKRISTKGLILMYHRIAECHPDPWALCVTPNHFREHLEVVWKYRPLRLDEFAGSMRNGKLPHRALVITFDDGYADNLYQAKPLLEGYGIPATLFLITGHVGSDREYWWDELEKVLLHPNGLPGSLVLNINGGEFRWELGPAADSGNCVRSERYPLYRSIHRLLLQLPGKKKQEVLSELLAWAGIESTNRESHRSLSYAEVLAVEKGGLMEIGSHSVTHSDLAHLPADAQRDEILCSKTRLEDILGHAVSSFSYPYGSYSNETVAAVREAGFACACSVSTGIVRQNSDLLRLPRMTVGDWGGEEFARRLEAWFEDDGE